MIEKIIETLEKDLKDRQGMWSNIAADVEEELRSEWRALLEPILERETASDTIFVVMGQSERYDDGFRRTWLVCYKHTFDAASNECNMLNTLAARMDPDVLARRDTVLSSDHNLLRFVHWHGADYVVRGVGGGE